MPEPDQAVFQSARGELPDRKITVAAGSDQTELMFKGGDPDGYDAVAERFDYFSQRFTSSITASMCDMAQLTGSATVLDIGTGTGIVASHLAGQADSGVQVVGIDLSFGMLSFASRCARQRGAENRVDFLMMDAERLAFHNGSFDAVLSLYALSHFPRPDQSLAEMYRVLKPGGTLVVGVGSGPPLLSSAGLTAAMSKIAGLTRSAMGRELRACEFLDALLRAHMPEGEVQEPAIGSGHGHLSGGAIPGLVKAAGFTRIRTDWAGQYSLIDSIDEFYQLQVTFSSLARKRLKNADDTAVRQLRARFDKRCESVKRRNGRLVYQSGAILVAGRKPS